MMLTKLFEDQSRTLLTGFQREQIELLEVNLVMLNYKFHTNSNTICLKVDNKFTFYIYYTNFDNSWNLAIIKKHELEVFNNLDELIEKLVKLI